MGSARTASPRPSLRAGCRDFFVARLSEGVALRAVLPSDARLLVLDGLASPNADPLLEHDLIPVLNERRDVGGWIGLARHAGRRLPAAIHVDTGMCRLGLSADEARRAAGDDLSGIDLVLVMSHLACAEDTDHPLNHLQLERFREAAALFPGVPRSLANSSGMFLGADWHFDLCRPGVALYGVNPTPGRPNPMPPVVTLEAPVLQQHDIAEVGTVGYGATRAVWPGERIVDRRRSGTPTAFPRSVGPGWSAKLLGFDLPLAGRVSMDTMCLDASAVPPDLLARRGTVVELVGGPDGVDRLAAAAGTIGYEILTRSAGVTSASTSTRTEAAPNEPFCDWSAARSSAPARPWASCRCSASARSPPGSPAPYYPRQILRQLARHRLLLAAGGGPDRDLHRHGAGAADLHRLLALQRRERHRRPSSSLSLTRELGPVLAGLMVAGRVGAAMAAEIGTMRVTEQIDALTTLATDPFATWSSRA